MVVEVGESMVKTKVSPADGVGRGGGNFLLRGPGLRRIDVQPGRLLRRDSSLFPRPHLDGILVDPAHRLRHRLSVNDATRDRGHR